MVNMRKMRRSNASRPDTAVAYRGPIRIPTNSGLDSRTILVNLSYSQDFIASGVGVIASYITGADASAANDWSNYSSAWQEFRVLGIRATWIPRAEGAYNTTVAPTTGCIAAVHIPLSAAPANVNEVCSLATWKPVRTYKPFIMEWRKRGIEESAFSSVTSTSSANHGGLFWYIDGCTNNANYGRMVFTFLVEFRAQR